MTQDMGKLRSDGVVNGSAFNTQVIVNGTCCDPEASSILSRDHHDEGGSRAGTEESLVGGEKTLLRLLTTEQQGKNTNLFGG